VSAKDPQEVEAYVNRLPMVRAGVVAVEVLSLRPFTGLAAPFESGH
jgi:hypothetical protein